MSSGCAWGQQGVEPRLHSLAMPEGSPSAMNPSAPVVTK